ncbi:hypothetical protein [Agromyces sp. Marseille-Q5079]|uniref:hypothetical protein n=1 Tax=Agromyces sp. Marseille-Q5079 TaxID=3439059 RepID=UPI003D9C88B7
MSGTLRLSGWATFRGERVEVGESKVPGCLEVFAEHELLADFDPHPPDMTYMYSRDSRGLADVPVEQLSRIVLVEERSTPISVMSDADVGVFASVDGAWARLANTSGFVRDGEAMLQLLRTDGQGVVRVTDVARADVGTVERREVRGDWRGVEVVVVAAGPQGVLVKGSGHARPQTEEGVHPADVRSPREPWSALVEPAEVQPLESSSWRRSLEPASFPSPIAEVDGVWWPLGSVSVVPDGRVTGAAGEWFVVQTWVAPDPSMRWYPGTRLGGSPWRRCVTEAELARVEWPETSALVDGERVRIDWITDRDVLAFDGQGALVPFERIEAIGYTSGPASLPSVPEIGYRRTYLELIGVDGLDELGQGPGRDGATVMQKAVTPEQATAIITHGLDVITGLVVTRADAAAARTPAELFEVHGLGYDGSPFVADEPVNVLLFESTPAMRFERAAEEDRPAVPGWWLAPTRVPPGARLVEFQRGKEPRVSMTYGDVGTGWLVPRPLPRRPAEPSACVGTQATMNGVTRPADVIGDRVVFVEPPDGTRVEVPRDAVEAVSVVEVLGSWNGLDIQVVATWSGDEGRLCRVVLLGHDAERAAAHGLSMVEPGVYEATVPEAELDGLRTVVRPLAEAEAEA